MRVDAENEVVIARPPGEVFAYLADAENDRAWRPAVLDIERVSGHGAGTRVRFGLAADLRGLKVAMAPAVRRSMAGEVGNLENLKRTLEEGRS